MMSPHSMEEEAGPLDDEVPEGRGGTVSMSALNSGDAFIPSRRTRREAEGVGVNTSPILSPSHSL